MFSEGFFLASFCNPTKLRPNNTSTTMKLSLAILASAVGSAAAFSSVPTALPSVSAKTSTSLSAASDVSTLGYTRSCLSCSHTPLVAALTPPSPPSHSVADGCVSATFPYLRALLRCLDLVLRWPPGGA